MLFVGEYRGGDVRKNTFAVKDKSGKPTGETETMETWEGIVEVRVANGTTDGKPVAKNVRLMNPKGEKLVVPIIEKGDICAVMVKALKFDEFSREHQVIASGVVPLPPAKESGKPYDLKPSTVPQGETKAGK